MFEQPEIILCEAVLDALTFWVNGFKNVTCLFGTEGFTDELWEALKKVQRIRIAYDADDAGERAAQRDTERFQQHGIEVFRVKFPHGMDANEYACKVKPADKSLALLMNAAQWADARPPAAPPPEPRKHVAMVVDEVTGEPLPIVDKESLETGVGWAPEPFVPAPYAEVQAQSLLLAASVSSPEPATKKESAASLEQRGDAWFMDIEGREYRVAGLEKTVGTDALKIALRLRHGERFHLDQVDLCRDMERRRFVERAAEETGLTADLLKRDLGPVVARGGAGAGGIIKAAGADRPRRHADAGGTRGGVDLVARAEPHWPFACGVPSGGHHRRGNATRSLRIWRACHANWNGRWPSSSRAPAQRARRRSWMPCCRSSRKKTASNTRP